MNWLAELWDKKIRTFIIVSFFGFLLLLIGKHYSDEIRYREAMMKYYIQDSVEIKLDNGFTLTIYKKDSTNIKQNETIDIPDAVIINGSIE